MHTSNGLADLLDRTVAAELPHLRAFPDGPATARPNRPTGKGWSMREELGHLIDSAVNNHVRFVRAALGPSYEGPGYDQEPWVAIHRYAERPWSALVGEWHAHNTILVPLIRNIPDAKLSTPCTVGGGAPCDLAFLIENYVLHMQHHLDQILRRPEVTKVPRGPEDR
jgi:hypothetical protein